MRGSCLCEAVQFDVDLPFERLAKCHCSRCQKASGTAHSVNAVVRPAAFRWIIGENRVLRYDLPSARSFATAVCRICGCPVPHPTRDGIFIIVPVGALDGSLGVAPDHHMHWESRADWYEQSEQMPRPG